jgi:DNA-binding response OmpR family regulator
MSDKKVLIVDDDPDLLHGLKVRLSSSGYNVVLATDAISAVNVARKEEPDVIILDIGLPHGDGFKVMGLLSWLEPLAHTPVIILTGRDPLTNLERSVEAGAQEFLQKPVDNDVLMAAIERALVESEGPAQKKRLSTEADTDTSRKKVLIVDDDRDLLHALNIRLSASGYDVVLATDAISGISVARKEKPDVIILDIGLPGDDGFTVIERLSSLDPDTHIPTIILTGRDIKRYMDRIVKARVQSLLRKPVDNNVLLATIDKALRVSGRPIQKRELPPERGPSSSGKKVLIVDDDLDLLRGLNVRLRANGYNVVFATDASLAISVAQKEKPDLIILDIGLPGDDGFAVMEQLSSLEALARIPIIILTCKEPLNNKERALNAGAKAFLQKPVDNNVLIPAIREALGQTLDVKWL